MLAAGGMVDAAIAAKAVLGVVEPFMNGWAAISSPWCTRPAPGPSMAQRQRPVTTGAVSATLRGRGMSAMPAAGIDSVTVPGAVAGW